MRPKTAETDQTWPLPVQASRGRALALTCNRQQDTLGPLMIRRRQNAETRDRMSVALGELCNLHNPDSMIMGGLATECYKLVTKFLQLAAFSVLACLTRHAVTPYR